MATTINTIARKVYATAPADAVPTRRVFTDAAGYMWRIHVRPVTGAPFTSEMIAYQEVEVVPVADLTLRVDGRVATYKLRGKTYTVFALPHGLTVPEMIENARPYESDLTPWVSESAYDAGIRVTF